MVGRNNKKFFYCFHTILLSTVYAFLFSFGVMLQHSTHINGWILIINWITIIPLFFLVIRGITDRIIKRGLEKNRIKTQKIFRKTDKMYLFATFFITVASYLLIFLAYYPGMNNYDAYYQVLQGIDRNFTTANPILHSLYLQFFLWFIGGTVLKNYTLGWALGNVVQMIVFAFAISYMHLFLYRIRSNKNVRYFLVAFFALNPIFPIMSISTTKDVFFTCFFLILTVSLAYKTIFPDIDKQNKIINWILFISIQFVVLLRNNSIIGLLFLSVFGGIYLLNVNFLFCRC